MTLKHVRPSVKLIADWCLAQDDLTGFHIEVREDPSRVLIILYWPNDWRSWRNFSLTEIELFPEPWVIVGLLEAFAAEARQRAAMVADPGRLSG